MPAPTIANKAITEVEQEAYDAVQEHGTIRAAGRAIKKNYSGVHRAYNSYVRKMNLDQAIADSMTAVGTGLIPALTWAKTKNSDGTSYSVLLKPQQETPQDYIAALQEGLDDITPGQYAETVSALPVASGSLLVMDLADVHVGKLTVQSETGYEYSRDAAVSRMLRGTQALLRKAQGHGVARVLFVLGNDILHVDGAKRQTTSGTPQDTHGSIHEMYRDAQAAYIAAIEACAVDHIVDLIYCPSNHDWLMGWALANSIGAWFRNHPNVNSSEYSLSEMHRKYYRYEGNLIGLTHGDGAKEADLYALMMTEARSHVSDAQHRYWYLHHFHHKIRKAQGVRPHDREKDHIGLTVIKSGVTSQLGDNVQIEYVRSPSPPDSWHDRNGYVNRQAVECFIHDPHDGQDARFTHWF
jgi:hypothetical protein